ncbi:MAG TPA: hypothetical protein VK480_08310 [Solirubrobacterales bacterium]|nr:hypothetical protein [Solirubrobacterales bacterium]
MVAVAVVAVELGDECLDLLALCFEGANPLADEGRIDACLDRGKLALDSVLHISELVGRPRPLGAVLAFGFRRQGGGLPAEVLQALRAEDARAEEGVDQRDQVVLTHVLPFAVAGCLGGGVAVGAAVAAGVIGIALAALALHPQRVVASGAVDDAAQQVEALLLPASAVAAATGAARLHLHLHALEVLLGDQRLVAPLGLDPLLGVAAD